MHLRDLQLFFRSVVDPLVVTDASGTILAASSGFLDLVGRTTEDAVGAPFHRFVDARHAGGHGTTAFDPDALGGRVDLVGTTPGGAEFAVRVRASSVEIEDHTAVLLSVRDTSERDHLLDQKRRAQRIGAIGRMTSGLSHDFANLLTVIVSNCALLDDSLQGRQSERELLEAIRGAATEGITLARKILAIGRDPVQRGEVVDARVVLTENESVIRRVLGPEIELDCSPGVAPLEVSFNRRQFEQVILNLVMNARDAMPGGGYLAIRANPFCIHSAANADEFLQFSFADTGFGMDAATVSRVFDPFFSTKDRRSGSGLGLTLVKRIVEEYGGHVNLSSAVSLGTTVELCLRRAEQPVHA